MTRFSLWRLIERHNKKYHFIILLSFMGSFIVSRLLVHLMDAQIIPDYYVLIGQTHIHHFNWGILLLALTGLLLFSVQTQKQKKLLAMFYGIGLGLAFDEFGMWLQLEDNYSSRLSYTAIVIIAAILINITYMGNIWLKIFTKAKNTKNRAAKISLFKILKRLK